jgi:hypothetical protein
MLIFLGLNGLKNHLHTTVFFRGIFQIGSYRTSKIDIAISEAEIMNEQFRRGFWA